MSIVYLEVNETLNAFEAEKVFAAGEEEELFTKEVTIANFTQMLFVVKRTSEGTLTFHDKRQKVGLAREIDVKIIALFCSYEV